MHLQGKEAIDDIIGAIKEEDSEFTEDFERFSRRSIRRLGRLLPDAGRVLPDDRSAVSILTLKRQSGTVYTYTVEHRKE